MLFNALLAIPLGLCLSNTNPEIKGSEFMPTKPSAQTEASSTEDLTTLMQRYTSYNLWANQQMADWLGTATEEQLDQEIESSFSTLKETIFHIWNAEYLWVQVVKDEPYDNSPAKGFEGPKDALMKGWLEASKNFNHHIHSMSMEDLQAQRPNSRGEGHLNILDMIQHCMNHSTYHRGQLITMGRQVGLGDPPRTDFIHYVGLEKE